MESTPTIVRALAALAAATSLLAAPGAAGASPSLAGKDVADKDKDKDKDKDAQEPDAVGCHNVIGGDGSYSRLQGLVVGSLKMTMLLEQQSCSTSTYTLRVYLGEADVTAVDSRTVAGDDSNAHIAFDMQFADARPSDPTDQNAVHCVFVEGETRDASGVLHDRAPDVGRVEICSGSGATSSFK